MKQFILISTLVLLGACSQTKNNLEGATTFSDYGSETSQPAGIVGGTVVSSDDEISHITAQLVAIEAVGKPNKQGMIKMSIAGCTVTILSDTMVLTARHCVTSENIFLYFGKDTPNAGGGDLFDSLKGNPNLRMVVNRAGVKAHFGANSDWGDIAILKFKGGLPPGFRPATLITPDVNMSVIKSVVIAGWGLIDGVKQTVTTTLRKANLDVIDSNYAETEMLVGSKTSFSCHGDSGGPAYINVDGKLMVAGLTSRADTKTDPKGQCIGDTVYTKVQPYLDFIKEATEQLRLAKDEVPPAAKPAPKQQAAN
jgi:hypothetical protein